MRRLRLDYVWWIVSPGNPLKDTRHLPSLEARLAAAQKLKRHPRIKVTGFEAKINTRYSFETISYLSQRCPGIHFVWIMGADNFLNFHRWKRWRDIADLVPLAIIDRPGSTLKATQGLAATALSRCRLDESDSRRLAFTTPPAFVFLYGPRSSLSSTALRAAVEIAGPIDRK